MIDILLDTGRLVWGHPMETHPVIDDTTRQQKINANGEPRIEVNFGVAIPKGQEQDWKQTPWGQKFMVAAQAGWPNGEWQSPTFAWKVTDGDSQIPNQRGNKPCDQEGYPGHWIISCRQGWPTPCYHTGRYQPHEVIQNKNEIKTGDYIRVQLQVEANAPSQSPGVYVNPALVELVRAGIQIISKNAPNAAEVFGSAPAPQLPPGAAVDPNVQAPPTPQGKGPAPTPTAPTPGAGPTAPATDYTNPPPPPVVMYFHEGQQYTKEQLLGFGWTEAQINTLQHT